MPALNEFLPPLLGGFLFSVQFWPLRLYLARADGYRLLFAVSVAALLLYVVAVAVITELTSTDVTTGVETWLTSNELKGLDRGLLALALGPLLATLLNFIWRITGRTESEVTTRFVHARSDPLEMTLLDFLSTQDLLMVTLKSGKVYIGRVVTSINPTRNVESIRLALHSSGYRDRHSHKLTIDVRYADTHAEIIERVKTNYRQAIQKYLAENADADVAKLEEDVYGSVDMSELGVANFETVIRISEVQSLSPFDPGIYYKYFRQGNTAGDGADSQSDQ